jgi:sulfonate transport system permease protein
MELDGGCLMRGAMWRLLRPWLVPFALLALWQLASRLGGHYSYALVPLQTLLATFIELSRSGELVRHAYASLEVVLRGLLTGGSIGLAVGGLMAYSATAAKLIGPLFNAWRPVPTLGFIPLIALWFGSGDLAKMVLVCLAAAEPMVLNTYEGLRHADRRLIESGQVLTFTRWQLFRYIQAPAAMPSIITGLQHALGFAWIATIGAELLFTIGPGLGGIMERAQNSARLDTVIVCVACIGAVGLAINSLVTHLGNRVLQWRDHA